MKHQRHFERASDATSREAAQISKMISDLDRLVRILDCEIATEEERARVSDRSDAAYPILARALAARRDNLKDTIAALEQRLANLPAVAELVLDLA
jgi:septation ring formation regulator EzrA